ncbi:MAG: methylmalonyl-CoA mutase family protein [Chloroherpetonaceae bacterium]|nr:methylmalonyl-CoA mutase family protein [Chloroherpetonaceae bacterium]
MTSPNMDIAISELERLEIDFQRWKEKNQANPELSQKFENLSWEKIEPLYTPLDTEPISYQNEIGNSGEFPYTRSIHQNLYRGKWWTMRLFSGFATPEETNARYKFLLERGQDGLSVAFDLPALMGWDCDHEMASGEVGVCGVSFSSLADMEVIFEGINLEKVSTSMTINSTAMIALAAFIATAQKQGRNLKQVRGTIQNDILKEYIAQKEYIFPPTPSMRIITDMFEYCATEMPKFNPISVSGYHIREAGSTAVQELAFTLADGFAYLEAAIERGMNVDVIAPRISFFFNSHNDFFEEIAKFRAARKIWAKRLRYKYGAKEERSWQLRFHTQTAGCTLTVQQPENNIVRVAFQALAAVLGGTQSLHTNSMDEALALPSEKAVRIALRTQQIIANETGVINTVDPLGGSYYLESLTVKIEEAVERYFEKIEGMGGMIEAIERGFPQKEIADASYKYQQEIDRKDRIIVGVNDYYEKDEKIDIPILKITPESQLMQIARLRELKASRNQEDVQTAIREIRDAAKNQTNLMPSLIKAMHAYVSLGEVCSVLREEFGEYQETPVF